MPISAAETAPVFAALGDPTRLTLVMRLADGRTASIAALAAETALTRQGVAKHLRVLQQNGLVAHTRAGRETRYAIRGEGVAAARMLLDEVAAQWDAALARLKLLVEAQSSD